MDNVVLVPEREFSEFKNWKSSRGAGGIVQAVRNPEQREMVKKFHAAQEIFNDSSRPYELRKAQYDETMRDFHTLKNKISGFRPNSIPAMGKTSKKRADDEDDKEKSVDDVVDLMPDSLKSNARNLMKRIQKNTDENLISWSPANGEVSIRGRRLEGSNIADLVGDVMRSSSSKSSRKENPNRVAFIDALAEMNAPETLIKNRDALKQFRQMKENNAPSPAKRTRAIVGENYHHQPPGIPEHILKESDYDDDDDYDVADEKLYRDTDLKKSNASPMSKMKKAIEWANTK